MCCGGVSGRRRGIGHDIIVSSVVNTRQWSEVAVMLGKPARCQV